jgi:hypothetical protein
MNLFESNNNNVWLFLGVLLACFAVSAGVRYQQFETWKQTPQAYFVGERPMMTTLDAPSFLRNAREYNEGILGKDTLQTYPGHSEIFNASLIPTEFTDPPTSPSTSGTPIIRYRDVSLLSFMIANLAPFFDTNYYLTGTLLIPVLASQIIIGIKKRSKVGNHKTEKRNIPVSYYWSS